MAGETVRASRILEKPLLPRRTTALKYESSIKVVESALAF